MKITEVHELGVHEMIYVIIRVIVVENEGHDHLKILKTIATGAYVGGKFHFSRPASLNVKLKAFTFIHDLNIAHHVGTLSVNVLLAR